MIIKKKIKLGINNYYVQINCLYKKDGDHNKFCLSSFKDCYFDSGDFSKLIEKTEEKYDKKIVLEKYGNEISFLADCLYIYHHIPFLDGIGQIQISQETKEFIEESYINKEELDDFIKENNIIIDNNKYFKLNDEETWSINKN